MKKGEITVVLLFQAFRIIVSAVLIIMAVNFCMRNTDVYQKNFDTAENLLEQMGNSNYKSSDLFILEPERQMGVFFRGDTDYVAQLTKNYWPLTVAGQGGFYDNPETNSLIPYFYKNIVDPVRIDKPGNCNRNNCFCIITGYEVEDSKTKMLNGEQLDFNGELFDSYHKINYDQIKCTGISKIPAAKQDIIVERNITVMKKDPSQGGIQTPQSAVGREEVYNIGGVFMPPTRAEVFQYVFSQNSGTDGFFVCKTEIEC